MNMVAYQITLLPELSYVHMVFHVSILHKCVRDSTHIIPTQSIQVDENLNCENDLV